MNRSLKRSQKDSLSAGSMTLGKSLIFLDPHSLSCSERAHIVPATVKNHAIWSQRL